MPTCLDTLFVLGRPSCRHRNLCACPLPAAPPPVTYRLTVTSCRSLLSVKELPCYSLSPLSFFTFLQRTDISSSVCIDFSLRLERELHRAGSVLFTLVYPAPGAALANMQTTYVYIHTHTFKFVNSYIELKRRNRQNRWQ